MDSKATASERRLWSGAPEALAAHAAAKARAVAAALRDMEAQGAAGHAANALLFAHIAIEDEDSDWISAAVRELNAATGAAEALTSMRAWGLGSGLAGIGWVVERVSTMFGVGRERGLNDHTDAALLRELERGRWRGATGLEEGLAGIGIYFLERLPSRPARQGVKLVADHLAATLQVPGSDVWNVARGLPGVISFLGEAVAAGIAPGVAEEVLGRAVGALEDSPDRPGGKGWDGRPGASAILRRCARTTGNAGAARLAAELLADARAPGPDGSGGESLRTGAAGAALSFARLYAMDGDERSLAGVTDSIRRSIGFVEPCPGALLDGTAGSALALLSLAGSAEPEWDRILGLSGRFDQGWHGEETT